LKSIHITKDEREKNWVKMERQKTDISYSVPLLKPALDLLENRSRVKSKNDVAATL
jgi:hypothetical protein